MEQRKILKSVQLNMKRKDAKYNAPMAFILHFKSCRYMYRSDTIEVLASTSIQILQAYIVGNGIPKMQAHAFI